MPVVKRWQPGSEYRNARENLKIKKHMRVDNTRALGLFKYSKLFLLISKIYISK